MLSLRRVVEPGDFKLQIGDLEKEMKFFVNFKKCI